MTAKTVAIIGSAGLVGSSLLQLLLKDEDVDTIRLIVRKPIQVTSTKVEMKLVDFSDYESLKLAIDGCDAVFSAIGTTMKKVGGDKTLYRKIDYDITVNAARAAFETRCEYFGFVSSIGADASSKNFYLQLKGEIENAVKSFHIKQIAIVRPSMLLGERKESRPLELIMKPVMSFFAFMAVGRFEKYRPIDASNVAAAMIQASKQIGSGVSIIDYEAIKKLAKLYLQG